MSDAIVGGLASALDPISREQIAEGYRRHAHSVLRRARRLLDSEAEAQEVLHELFLSLLERPAQFHRASSLLTWLYSATTHCCLNRLRNGRNRQRILDNSGELTQATASDCAPDRAVELQRLLCRLPLELATIAVYLYVDCLTYDEIAEVMGCSRRKVAYQVEQLRALTKSEGCVHG